MISDPHWTRLTDSASPPGFEDLSASLDGFHDWVIQGFALTPAPGPEGMTFGYDARLTLADPYARFPVVSVTLLLSDVDAASFAGLASLQDELACLTLEPQGEGLRLSSGADGQLSLLAGAVRVEAAGPASA